MSGSFIPKFSFVICIPSAETETPVPFNWVNFLLCAFPASVDLFAAAALCRPTLQRARKRIDKTRKYEESSSLILAQVRCQGCCKSSTPDYDPSCRVCEQSSDCGRSIKENHAKCWHRVPKLHILIEPSLKHRPAPPLTGDLTSLSSPRSMLRNLLSYVSYYQWKGRERATVVCLEFSIEIY